ncbi:hypothetical protein RFI_02384 [Reticulomyxa filosa]|uniref:Uncharacterized protein n=1 Tax=Reticulomyxa filosa TaxID=46433 RepID=X6P945_RETFI|nr:hypothetical protein RFI_02384 [Reticulomyxa filosa]|eukprot:ETO34706.1 hypothetical protein RFI_02384 [Reticulomyxa filosa]
MQKAKKHESVRVKQEAVGQSNFSESSRKSGAFAGIGKENGHLRKESLSKASVKAERHNGDSSLSSENVEDVSELPIEEANESDAAEDKSIGNISVSDNEHKDIEEKSKQDGNVDYRFLYDGLKFLIEKFSSLQKEMDSLEKRSFTHTFPFLKNIPTTNANPNIPFKRDPCGYGEKKKETFHNDDGTANPIKTNGNCHHEDIEKKESSFSVVENNTCAIPSLHLSQMEQIKKNSLLVKQETRSSIDKPMHSNSDMLCHENTHTPKTPRYLDSEGNSKQFKSENKTNDSNHLVATSSGSVREIDAPLSFASLATTGNESNHCKVEASCTNRELLAKIENVNELKTTSLNADIHNMLYTLNNQVEHCCQQVKLENDKNEESRTKLFHTLEIQNQHILRLMHQVETQQNEITTLQNVVKDLKQQWSLSTQKNSHISASFENNNSKQDISGSNTAIEPAEKIASEDKICNIVPKVNHGKKCMKYLLLYNKN